MLATMGKQLLVTLLATALMAAPVWASVPRCCQTGAIAGGGNCCCSLQSESTDTPTCCSKSRPTTSHSEQAPGACCQLAAEPASDEIDLRSAGEAPQSISSAPCACGKQASQPAAIASNTSRTESADASQSVSLLAHSAESPADTIFRSADPSTHPAPPGVPLRIALCRWVI